MKEVKNEMEELVSSISFALDEILVLECSEILDDLYDEGNYEEIKNLVKKWSVTYGHDKILSIINETSLSDSIINLIGN